MLGLLAGGRGSSPWAWLGYRRIGYFSPYRSPELANLGADNVGFLPEHLVAACGGGVTTVTFARKSNSPITPARRTVYRHGSQAIFSEHSAVPSGRVTSRAEE